MSAQVARYQDKDTDKDNLPARQTQGVAMSLYLHIKFKSQVVLATVLTPTRKPF